MIAWIASPLARKFILYGAAGAAIFLCLRWWGNRQWQQGEHQGRQAATLEIERLKAAEWKAKEDAIAADAASVADEKRSVRAAAEQLARDRASIQESFKTALARIQAERLNQYADSAAVPDDRIWRDIRTVSGQLAAHD